MILTVTPNPSLDRTYELPGLTRGAVLRATYDRVDPGGKGINVSRAVAAAGHRTIAVAPLGGPEGALLARLLGEHGIEAAGVPIVGSTRINVTLVEPDGTLTKVNAVGPEITVTEAEALLDAVRTRSATTDWIVCCGSLPRGLSPQWYAELVARSHRAGARIALDTSGAALIAALPERPDVVKPNAEELAGCRRSPTADGGRRREGGGGAPRARCPVRSGQPRGRRATAGRRYGYVLRQRPSGHGPQQCRGLADASLAGFLTAGGRGPAALAAAVAHGAAAVQLPGSVMPTPTEIDLSAVTTTTDIALDRPLTDPAS